jgi:hypothetical protein
MVYMVKHFPADNEGLLHQLFLSLRPPAANHTLRMCNLPLYIVRTVDDERILIHWEGPSFRLGFWTGFSM